MSVEPKFHQKQDYITLNNFGIMYILQEVVLIACYENWDSGE
jgi:hypothetical protein